MLLPRIHPRTHSAQDTVLSLRPEAVRERLGELRLFDARPALHLRQDGLPGSEGLTLEQVQAGDLPDCPKDAALCVVCERGQVSELVALYLEAAGFSEVYNLAGGLAAWRATNQNV